MKKIIILILGISILLLGSGCYEPDFHKDKDYEEDEYFKLLDKGEYIQIVGLQDLVLKEGKLEVSVPIRDEDYVVLGGEYSCGFMETCSMLLGNNEIKIVELNGEVFFYQDIFKATKEIEEFYLNVSPERRFVDKFYDVFSSGNVPDKFYVPYGMYEEEVEGGKRVEEAKTTYYYNYLDAPNENRYRISNDIETPKSPPRRLGYQFLGWYIDEEGEEEWTFRDLENYPRQLYAKWRKNGLED